MRGAGTAWTPLGERHSLAQSWGQRFLSTAGVGLGDCTAAQENLWAPSAWCHAFGWSWKRPGALQLLCLITAIPCEMRVQHSSSGQARLQRWRHVPFFCVAALIPGPGRYLGPGSLCSVSPGWTKDRCLPQGMGGARLLTATTGPLCSRLGHLVLPQVTSSKKSSLQGWRSLNPYYALTGIWHCWLEMDVHPEHTVTREGLLPVVFVVIQILKLWSIIWRIVKCPQSLNTFTSSPCSSLLWLSVLSSFPLFLLGALSLGLLLSPVALGCLGVGGGWFWGFFCSLAVQSVYIFLYSSVVFY